MNDNLKRAQLRAAQYQHGDGTIDLTFGSVFLLAAICFWGIYKISSSHSMFSTKILPVLTLAGFLGAAILIDALVKWFKRRVTAPRNGSVIPRKLGPLSRVAHRSIWIGIPVLTIGLMAVLFLFRAQFQMENQDAANVLLPLFWGMLFGGLWFLAARKIGLNHFYLMAVVSLLVSGMLFVTGAAGIPAMVILCGALGTALTISGVIMMLHFLQNTGLPKEAASGN